MRQIIPVFSQFFGHFYVVSVSNKIPTLEMIITNATIRYVILSFYRLFAVTMSIGFHHFLSTLKTNADAIILKCTWIPVTKNGPAFEQSRRQCMRPKRRQD